MFYSLEKIWLVFLLIHQQMLFHGIWATRTPRKESSSVMEETLLTTSKVELEKFSTTFPPHLGMKEEALLVSSSEATLLTKPELMSTVMKMHQSQIDFGDDINSDSIEQNGISEASVETKSKTLGNLSSSASANNKKIKSNFNKKGSNLKYQNKQQDQQQFNNNNNNNINNKQKKSYKIISIQTNCTRDLFEMHLNLNRDFHGLLYAKDFPLECRSRGNSHNKVTLRLPTSGCGVRAEPRADGSMELSVRIMLQIEQKLRQSSDILRTIRCKLPATAMGMNVFLASAANRGRYGIRNGRMRLINKSNNNNNSKNNYNNSDINQMPQINDTLDVAQTPSNSLNDLNADNSFQSSVPIETSTSSSAAPQAPTASTTPRVRIWLELGGPNGSGSVEVGVATTLTVRAIVPGTMGVRVVECAALDGLGDSTQQLLDERGCPIDEQVMPELHTRYKPAEEGWSKQSEDDLVEKTFTATFPAFKFPDRERLHVSCGVQLCKGKCPDVNCKANDKLLLATDKHLARIEVFNSLAVTAPQIEVDRLRYERYFNQSDEYSYVRTGPGEGTLCLSVSKLAISFCILGLIFLIAVIVAVSSLIRSKKRTPPIPSGYSSGSTNRAYRTEVSTSMFSSSSDSAQSGRFGSKLLIPYYPNTLPYGRVY